MNKHYAVLIGINDKDIHGCSKDVEDIRIMLENIYRVPSQNIITIVRENHIENPNPNEMNKILSTSIREKVMDAMEFLLERAKKNDDNNVREDGISHVWLHVSSHGKKVAYDRSSIFKIDEGKYISSKWITRELSKLPNSCEIFMTFDYCHSGYYHQLPYMYETHPQGMLRRKVKIDSNKNEDQNEYEMHPRMFCIASTSNDYSSDVLYKEVDGFRGAFTSAILDGLKHHGYKVTLPKLFETIQNIMRIRNHEQQPRLFSSSMDPYTFIFRSHSLL